jgi:hypothetical protein
VVCGRERVSVDLRVGDEVGTLLHAVKDGEEGGVWCS